jgi:hypothetical protein
MGGDAPDNSEEERRRKDKGQRSDGSGSPDPRYDTGSAVQVLGSGKLAGEERQYLTADEQRELSKP